jgi:glycosyltransferase involved in cell wall biosynthesis
VITQQAVSASTLDICSQEGIRSVLFLQNVDFFCLGSFWSGKPWKCEYRCIGCSDSAGRAYQFPCFRTEIQRTRRSLSAASEIVTNSEFMKRTLRDLLDLDSIVVEPEARDLAPKDSTVRKEELLFFSPLAHKGVDIALALAKRLPSRRFLFVGDTRMKSRLRMSSLENVEYLTWTDAPLRCYQRSRLLLVPSRIPEGFGMACVEAMGLGIPCIVSDVGALPETVGRGGDCVSTWAVDAWVEAIARYDDPSYYHQKSQEAIEQARKLESFPRYERLLSIIDEIIS